MNIISSHKTLFIKFLAYSIFLTLLSAILLNLIGQPLIFSLFPLFGFLFFGHLVFKYLMTFAAHLATLKRNLQSDKQGNEIFCRDQQFLKGDIYEMSEIFGLVDQNLGEKSLYKRWLDIFGSIIKMLGENDQDQNSASKIIEIIAKHMNCRAGLFCSLNGDDSVTIYGHHNCDEEKIRIISQTPIGPGLFSSIQRQDDKYLLVNIKECSEGDPWRKIFKNDDRVLAIPVRSGSTTNGILILINDESDWDYQISGRNAEIISNLLTIVIKEIKAKIERSSRFDTSRLLQETSLAISSTLDLLSVLKVVAGRLTEYSSATYCLILLNTDISGIMEVASFFTRRKEKDSSSDSQRISLAEFPSFSKVVDSQKMSILGPQDLSDFSSYEKHFFGTEKIKRLIIIPISHSANSVGVVVLGEERSRERSQLSQERLSFMQAMASQAAVAIENARLYSFINHKVSQLTTLYNVSAVIHSDINVDIMLEEVLSATLEYLRYSIAGIFSLDKKTGCLRLLTANGPQDAVILQSAGKVSDDSVVSLVAAEGKPIRIDDIRIEETVKASYPDMLSELAVPIKIGKRIIGVYSIASTRKFAFTQFEEGFLQALGAQIAVAMERGYLFDQEREQKLKLKTIFDVSRKLSQSLNLQDVMNTATSSIRESFGYQLVAIFLPDNDTKCYYVGGQSALASSGLPPQFKVPFGKGLVAKAAESRRDCYCADVENDPNYIKAIPEIKSEISIPIIMADKLLGVLDVESMEPNDFDTEDIKALEALSDIIAVALDNSYLFEETTAKAERLALIDNINRAVSATLDLDSFFKVVARSVADNAGYPWTSLVILENNSFIFKADYTSKSAGPIMPEPVLQVLQDQLRIVIEHAKPEFVSLSLLNEIDKSGKLHQIIDAGVQYLGLFPIGDAHRADAVMIVGSSRSEGFSPQELALLRDLAVHLGIAWQNAKLYRQLKTAYEQLQEAQERIIQTEKLRALGEMSSGVVHDFNNILAAILGRTQLLQHKLNKSDGPGHLESLHKNLDIIEKAISDGSQILSRISEFTKKKTTEKFIRLDLGQIISDAIELTRPRWGFQAKSSGKIIDVQYQQDGRLDIMGSPSELREVFTNLIINAVDAIKDNGIISIETSVRSDSSIRVIFSDNGSGMSDDTKKRIFEPFFTTKGERGTGLGLAVTYGIIDRHKGSIEVESKLGIGSKFTIKIPLASDSENNALTPIEYLPQKKTFSILVIDDEDGFRDVLAEILTSDGHAADSAPDGITALKMLGNKEYDIVITDLGMPNLSGWEIADAVFATQPGIKVIIATGWGAQLEPGKLSLHHINGLITKPFKIEEILSMVDRIMTCSRDEVLIVEA